MEVNSKRTVSGEGQSTAPREVEKIAGEGAAGAARNNLELVKNVNGALATAVAAVRGESNPGLVNDTFTEIVKTIEFNEENSSVGVHVDHHV